MKLGSPKEPTNLLVFSISPSILRTNSAAPQSRVQALVQRHLRQRSSQHQRGPCGPKEALLESVRYPVAAQPRWENDNPTSQFLCFRENKGCQTNRTRNCAKRHLFFKPWAAWAPPFFTSIIFFWWEIQGGFESPNVLQSLWTKTL